VREKGEKKKIKVRKRTGEVSKTKMETVGQRNTREGQFNKTC